MNDEIVTPIDPTPQQKAEAEKANRIAAKAEAFKAYEGKTFAPKSGKCGLIRIVKYGGVGIRVPDQARPDLAVREHFFVVEGKGTRWCPPATQFLADYDEVVIDPPTTPTTDEPI
jgi:mannose-6-phosphate isomerase-like protein (cupin superfamily)